VRVKRCFDFLMSLAGLLFLLPVFLVVSLLIKMDSCGPVFFRQERVGRYGAVFRILKFRTMKTGGNGGMQITVGRDARITRIGYFLRRYKIDEFPQLINVLAGDMSLVGPRPEVSRYVACYPNDVRDIVLSVRPGITDLASIEYREESAILGRVHDPEKIYVDEILPIKLNYYVRYVRDRTFVMDLKIILGTVAAIFGIRSREFPPSGSP
jgi:lipopolysaccharide/colanic/teichoic acid biosynthesis glycosyltransferase